MTACVVMFHINFQQLDATSKNRRYFIDLVQKKAPLKWGVISFMLYHSSFYTVLHSSAHNALYLLMYF